MLLFSLHETRRLKHFLSDCNRRTVRTEEVPGLGSFPLTKILNMAGQNGYTGLSH